MIDSEVYKKPVQGDQDGCDVGSSPGFNQQSSNSVLNRLQVGHGLLGNSRVEGVAVVGYEEDRGCRGYEGVDGYFHVWVVEERLYFGYGS